MGCLPGAEIKVETSVSDNTEKSKGQTTTDTTKQTKTEVSGNTTTTTTTTTTKQIGETTTIQPGATGYAAYASFETEFSMSAFAGVKAYQAPIEVSYDAEGVEYKMEISKAQFGPNGEILIDGKEGEHVFTMRGRFSVDGKVRMVKYYETHKVKYVGQLKENMITGMWYLPEDSSTFKIVFKGKSWTYLEDYVLTYADDSVITSVGQFEGKWGVVTGTKAGDNLNLKVYFPDGTQTKMTATEAPESLQCTYTKLDGTIEELTLFPH